MFLCRAILTSIVIENKSIEIVQMRKEGEYFIVQLAIDGVLAPSMDVHASAREEYRTEQSWMEYLVRQSESLIEVYGDARNPRPVSPAFMAEDLAPDFAGMPA
jgi:hypothetical protein